MYRFLLSRQWVILTLLGLALIPAMIKLGFWQLHRHESRVAHNELISSSLRAEPVSFDRLSSPAHGPAEDEQFRTAKATGRYDARHEVVVRQRTGADGKSIGYFVVTPLVRDDGSAVLVNRGWIEAGGDLTRFPDVPAPPLGKVTVTGRVMADETSEASGIKDKRGLPPRQVMLINSDRLAGTLGRPVLRGYLQLTSTSPKPAAGQPQRIPEPDHSSIGAHMAYAVQWWLFAAGVPVGWVILVRRERRDRAAAPGTAPSEGSEAAEAGGARVSGTPRDGSGRDGEGDGSGDAPNHASNDDESGAEGDGEQEKTPPSTAPAGIPSSAD